MLRAGLPVLNTLEMLDGQTKKTRNEKCYSNNKKGFRVRKCIIKKCFEKHPKVFDTVVVNLIKAGEASGKLDTFLQNSCFFRKKRKIKSQIKSALFYPGVLFSVAILVTVFMLMNVVPTFVNMYEGMGMGDDLPTPTAVIMSMSEFIRSSGGFFLLIFLILFVVGFPKFLINKNYNIKKTASGIT